jgi:hypothetical protein
VTAQDINAGLDVLRNYYARDGRAHELNDVQLSVYLDGLTPFTPDAFRAASIAWMHRSKWFPALSDLLGLLEPEANPEQQAALAWATFERAVGSVGAYGSVQFADPCIGECVRQVFGSWPIACSFAYDSPGWSQRRQQFMAIFPVLVGRQFSYSPVLAGQHHRIGGGACLIPHVEGLPAPRKQLGDCGEPSPKEAGRLIGDIQRRFQASTQRKDGAA